MRHPALTAAAFDRDDPFTYARVVTHAKYGIANHNYEKSRRLPAPIEERFRLGRIRHS
jgi:hypothetical protein